MFKKSLAIIILLFAFLTEALAQFKEEAFSQTYADPNDTTAVDTAATMFSLKNYYRGIRHLEPIKIGTAFAGSTVFVGGMQIYNRQTWKLPIFYGGIATGLGGGIYYRDKYNKSVSEFKASLEADPLSSSTIDKHSQHISNYFLIGAAAFWWASLADGVGNFNKGTYPQPGKATIYSILCPGLGQIYNHEYWKLPIYWGGILGSYHYYSNFRTNYLKYKNIYNAASANDGSYDGPISSSTAKYYKDIYRRYRDYSVLAMAAFYLLQIIDANVFAYMGDFEMSDDLTLNVSPTLISPDSAYALNYSSAPTGVGLRIGFTF